MFSIRCSMRRGWSALLLVAVVGLACNEAPVAVEGEDATALIGDVSIREAIRALPNQMAGGSYSRGDAESLGDKELTAALRASAGRAYIRVKRGSSPRFSATGTLSSLTRNELARAVAELLDAGVGEIQPIGSMGLLAVTLAPELAPEIRARAFVDFVAPIFPAVDQGVSAASVASAAAFSAQDTSWGIVAMRAPDVWNGTRGAATRGAGVRVSVIESGHDLTHLNNQSVANLSCDSIPGSGGCYDDHAEILGHGAGVAGVVAAANNGVGTLGVAHGVDRLRNIKACKEVPSGFGHVQRCDGASIAEAIYESMKGSGPRHIISTSFGLCHNDTGLRLAIEEAAANGHLLVAAAGNAYNNYNHCPSLRDFAFNLSLTAVMYPARYPAVMAVSGILPGNVFAMPGARIAPPTRGDPDPDPDPREPDPEDPVVPLPCDPSVESCNQSLQTIPHVDCRTDEGSLLGSRSGPEVEIAAPFTWYGLTNAGQYGTICGTSFAAPAVAGVAALVWSANPQLSAAQVRARLVQNAQPLGNPHLFGAGRVDALNAAFPPLTFSIVGELIVTTPGNKTYWALVKGGTGTYTYEWSSADNADGPYIPAGTGSTFTIRIDEWSPPERHIRLRMTSGLQENTEHLIVYNETNNPCAPSLCWYIKAR